MRGDTVFEFVSDVDLEISLSGHKVASGVLQNVILSYLIIVHTQCPVILICYTASKTCVQ